MKNQSRGVAQNNINLTMLRQLRIPKIAIDKQNDIVSQLDLIAELVEIKENQIINFEKMIKEKHNSMFNDKYTKSKLGDVIDVLTDYNSNGSYKNIADNVTLLNEPNYAYMVRTIDLENNNYVKNVKYIDEHAYNFLEKSKVYGGELIMNKIGSAGKIYLMPYLNKPVSLGMNQFLIRFKKTANANYIYHSLKTKDGKNEIEQRIRGAVTKTITKDAVRDINIIIPPLELQNEFGEFVTIVKEQKEIINKEIEKLKYLFDTKMNEYFG
jgi:type I restriction enzyme S subunit